MEKKNYSYTHPPQDELWMSHSKISKRMITELFYSHILNMSRGSLHTGSFRRIHLSVFTADELKWHFGRKTFQGLLRSGPRARVLTVELTDKLLINLYGYLWENN